MSPPIAELKGALACERLARHIGTILFAYRGEVYILHKKKNSPHLGALVDRYHDAIIWICQARISV